VGRENGNYFGREELRDSVHRGEECTAEAILTSMEQRSRVRFLQSFDRGSKMDTPNTPPVFPPPPPPFNPSSDPDKIVWMLSAIRETLRFLVHFDEPPALDFHSGTRFREQWPEVERAITDAIKAATEQFSYMAPKLAQAGMTNQMLALKTASLAECVDGLYREVNTGSPIFSLKFLRPTLKCLNSILGSLLGALPGLEMVKEFKDHFKVGLDVAEAKRAK
jgi:hypothetical protein